MYTIGHSVYGLPIPENKYQEGDKIFEYIEDGVKGFHYFYGETDPPHLFGIKLSRFDCFEFTELNKINLTPTAAQLAQYQQAFNALSAIEQAELNKLGQPRVFVIWTTS